MSTTYAKPLPKITPLTKPFWDNAKLGKLSMQQCDDCRDMHFPPAPVCPACLSDAQSWTVVSGDGTLESWVDFHRAYWTGFEPELPYRVCLVRLAEGPLLASNLVGESDAAKLGAPVKAIFDAVTENVTLPKFKLA